MFIFDFIFSIAKIIVIAVGTVFSCAFVCGKTGPFKRSIRRIERRKHKNTCSYCHH